MPTEKDLRTSLLTGGYALIILGGLIQNAAAHDTLIQEALGTLGTIALGATIEAAGFYCLGYRHGMTRKRRDQTHG